MLSIVVGFIFLGLGLWGLISWFPDFLVVARGLAPISLVFGGVIAILAGFSAVKPSSPKRTDDHQ